jgi:hypothetical protein
MENLEKISKQKLLKAGFKFLRLGIGGANLTEKEITVCEERYGVWKLYGRYPTKAERERKARELIEAKGSMYIIID